MDNPNGNSAHRPNLGDSVRVTDSGRVGKVGAVSGTDQTCLVRFEDLSGNLLWLTHWLPWSAVTVLVREGPIA